MVCAIFQNQKKKAARSFLVKDDQKKHKNMALLTKTPHELKTLFLAPLSIEEFLQTAKSNKALRDFAHRHLKDVAQARYPNNKKLALCDYVFKEGKACPSVFPTRRFELLGNDLRMCEGYCDYKNGEKLTEKQNIKGAQDAFQRYRRLVIKGSPFVFPKELDHHLDYLAKLLGMQESRWANENPIEAQIASVNYNPWIRLQKEWAASFQEDSKQKKKKEKKENATILCPDRQDWNLRRDNESVEL